MYPESLRGPFYFMVVWSLCVLDLIFICSVINSPFIWCYFMAFTAIVIGIIATAGFGLAEYFQARYDERKLRKQAENFLYDQTSFHSEGGY